VARARVERSRETQAASMPSTGACLLERDEALSVAAMRIQRMVAHDAIVYFACEGGFVNAKFAAGDDHRLLRSLTVPHGEGLVGWVADTGKPILNGNPSVEPGYACEHGREIAHGSALALPLTHGGRTVGVLALYRNAKDSFAAHEMVSLLPVCPSIAGLLVEIPSEPACISDYSAFAEAVAAREAPEQVAISA
jgi:signal transduction protein with GAF and PtsI domain